MGLLDTQVSNLKEKKINFNRRHTYGPHGHVNSANFVPLTLHIRTISEKRVPAPIKVFFRPKITLGLSMIAQINIPVYRLMTTLNLT